MLRKDNNVSQISTSPIYGLQLASLKSKKCSATTHTSETTHILPSYQMHQSILNRSIVPSAETIAERERILPEYSSVPEISDETQAEAEDQATDFTQSILNNIHILPAVPKKQVKISIQIDQERLKKPYFTNGDIISGYSILENLSSEQIPFEMFFTTLEGNSRVSSSEFVMAGDSYKTRSFLRMVDLGGSWTETDMEYLQQASAENQTFIGLPRNKVLLPHAKYQKPFQFQIPENPLETSCGQDIYTHLQLPPSMGSNNILYPPKGLQYSDQELERFKYNDLSSLEFSINYSIDVRLITKSKLTGNTLISGFDRYLFRAIPSKKLNKDAFPFVLSPEKSLVMLHKAISNDIKSATDIEKDTSQTKAMNLYLPRTDDTWKDCYPQGRYNSSFKTISNTKVPIPFYGNEKSEAESGILTFSSKAAIKLDFDRMASAINPKNKSPKVYVPIEMAYRPHVNSSCENQRSYLSISKMQNLVPENISADIYYVNVHAKGVPVPIELDPLWFTSSHIFNDKITTKFNELNSRMMNLPKDAQLYATTLMALKAMRNLTYKTAIIPKSVAAKAITRTPIEIVQNEYLKELYKCSMLLELSPDDRKLRSVLMLPDFQECLTSRFYFLRLKFKSTSVFDSTHSVQYNPTNGSVIDQLGNKIYRFYLDIPLEIKKN